MDRTIIRIAWITVKSMQAAIHIYLQMDNTNQHGLINVSCRADSTYI